jgi:hypothetical protein
MSPQGLKFTGCIWTKRLATIATWRPGDSKTRLPPGNLDTTAASDDQRHAVVPLPLGGRKPEGGVNGMLSLRIT